MRVTLLYVVADRCADLQLPYMSAGAAMAIEDGVVLGRCLGRVKSTEDIPAALEAYEHLRRSRSYEVQRRSALNGKIWHLPDGPEQIARDEGMAAEVLGRPFIDSTNQWSDPAVSQWLYGADVEAEADRHLDACSWVRSSSPVQS